MLCVLVKVRGKEGLRAEQEQVRVHAVQGAGVWALYSYRYVGQNRIPIHTVYDCIFSDFPAKNTVNIPYI
jgi:hypothetical protein